MKTKVIMSLITIGLIIFVVIVSLTNNPDEGATMGDVAFEDGVINVYYFYGDGCPHCDAQFQFLERIEEEWGAYFNLYAFEVWFNEDNVVLLNDVAEILDMQVTGIPFTVIGEQTFTGFNERMEEGFIEAIRTGANDDFDVFRSLVEQ